jgi:hypothetical protein
VKTKFLIANLRKSTIDGHKHNSTMVSDASTSTVLGLLANLKQHARLSEACLVEATSDNDLSVERNSMNN